MCVAHFVSTFTSQPNAYDGSGILLNSFVLNRRDRTYENAFSQFADGRCLHYDGVALQLYGEETVACAVAASEAEITDDYADELCGFAALPRDKSPRWRHVMVCSTRSSKAKKFCQLFGPNMDSMQESFCKKSLVSMNSSRRKLTFFQLLEKSTNRSAHQSTLDLSRVNLMPHVRS